jgi:undecaprenyl diphosphate synthase
MHIPGHLAIIMDGNGRWAKKRGLPRLSGHQAGIRRVHTVVTALDAYQVKYVTLYGFSTENWSRPEEEVTGILHLLEESIDEEALELHRHNVKILHIGRLSELPENLQEAIQRSIELTHNNSGMTLTLAFNYGGRAEIVDAVRAIAENKISPADIDEKKFEKYLYTAELPDVDLLIRTGGELRISNFLLWKAAYCEFYFTHVLWPDFTRKYLERALASYSNRKRRFGGL